MAYFDKYGVKFSDDRKTLVKFPIDYTGSYRIPDGVESIESGAFKEPYGYGGQPEYKGCDGLSYIYIPDSLKVIKNNALKWCKNLHHISVGTSNPCYCVEDGVLFDKYKKVLIKYFRTEPQDNYIVPESVQMIEEFAFAHNPHLVSVELRHVKKIGKRAFASCDSLEVIHMFDAIDEIGQYAFCLCSSLKSVELPLGLKRISEALFYKCSSLEYVVIPKSVTTIDSCAFEECTSLMAIDIPDSINFISAGAFAQSGLQMDEKNWEDGVLYIGNYLIKAKKSLCGTYRIKDGTTHICDYAFFRCFMLREVQIPNSVKFIGNSAFDYCTVLRTVAIPEGVISVGESAFSHCEMLNKVVIPESLISIGNYAFADCKSLKSIISTEIFAFDGIYISSVDIKIPNGVTYVGRGAFGDCISIESIAFPEGVSEIAEDICSHCFNLKSVHLPSTTVSIGSCAFSGCTVLESINLPDSIMSVGYNVFENCFSLREIVVSKKCQDKFHIMKGLESVAYRIVGRDIKDGVGLGMRSWDELENIWLDLYHNLEEGETQVDKKVLELLKSGQTPSSIPPIGVCVSSDEYRYYKMQGLDLQSIHAWCWSGRDIHETIRLHLNNTVGIYTPRVGYYKVVKTDINKDEKPTKLYCYYIGKDIRNKENDLDFLDEVVEINPSPLYNFYSYGPKNAIIKEGDVIKILSNELRDLHRTEGKSYVIHWEFVELDNSRDMVSFSGHERNMSTQEVNEELRYAIAEEQFWNDYLDKLNRGE